MLEPDMQKLIEEERKEMLMPIDGSEDQEEEKVDLKML
jgi:hypothetical protein